MLGRVRRYLLQRKARRLFGRSVAVFGDFTVLDPRHVRIGNNCAINHGVFLHGQAGIEIGDDVVLSARCMLLDAGLDPRTFGRPDQRRYANRPITVGNGAWIGAAAIVLPGVTIGSGSVVGAGSVVTADIPPGSIVAGNPARQIGRTDAHG